MKWLSAFIMALALAGCATTYGPARFGKVGGYEETQISPGRYAIEASSNAPAGEFSMTMALYRAAELAIEQGYSHFAVIDAVSSDRYLDYSDLSGFAGDEARIEVILQNSVTPPYVPGSPQVFAASEVIAALQSEIDRRQ